MGGMLLFRRAILLSSEMLSSYQSTHAASGSEGGISERQYVALNGESGRRMERRKADGWVLPLETWLRLYCAKMTRTVANEFCF